MQPYTRSNDNPEGQVWIWTQNSVADHISICKRKFCRIHSKHRFTSILKFIEDNWNLGQIGGGSLDYKANSLNNMFDFKSPNFNTLILNPTTEQKK